MVAELPLVSCIMPTRGRADLVARSLGCFRAQTWARRELVVVDDAECPTFPAGISEPGIFYDCRPHRMTIGAKRNLAAGFCAGEIVCHWDDDDYSAPDRIARQVERLIDCEVTGYNAMKFTDGARWWKYTGPKNYALGTSLCYWKSYWKSNPFPDLRVGEDLAFTSRAASQCVLVALDAGDEMYATIHPGNTCARTRDGNWWKEIAA